jgi:hypothetical protein
VFGSSYNGRVRSFWSLVMPHLHLTESQYAALDREDAVLDATYPGEYVAYIDSWSGNELTRRVLAHAPDSEGFHAQMAAVDPELAMRAAMTRTPDPNDTVWLPAQTA